jgi:hypothetical protein
VVRPLFEENMTMRSLAASAGSVQRRRVGSLGIATLAMVTILAGGNRGAQAGYVLSGGSSADTIVTNLTVAGVASSVTVNPLSGTFPATYSTTNQLLSGSAGVTGVLSAATGVNTSTIGSTLNGVGTTGSATSSNLINGTGANVTILGLLNIQASVLMTNASASGTSTDLAGSLTSSGMASVEGLKATVAGGLVDITSQLKDGAFVDLSANLGLAKGAVLVGIDIVGTSGDGITSAGATADNIIVQLNTNVLNLGLVSGTIDIGQSSASVAATAASVPEPSSVVMTVFGLLMTGFAGIRRTRKSWLRLA